MIDDYASGSWNVTPGSEEEFVKRWTEFISWSRSEFPAMTRASLLRDSQVPGHFISFAEWSEAGQRAAWKQSAGFQQRFSACRALCDTMSGSDYLRVVTV
ncbi:MAG TPA: antibiotic biosynthesis monooxygenase [Kribbellaceae bacterium]|jgi:quinol monooxygenase YgiN